MGDQAIVRKSASLTEQSFTAALAKALGEIKQQDGLTFEDMAAVLGKCPEQVAKYYEGSAKMDALTLYRGKAAWNGRLTGYIDRLAGAASHALSGRQTEGKVLGAALALSIALSNDNEISDREIFQNRTSLEEARDSIDALLKRVAVPS